MRPTSQLTWQLYVLAAVCLLAGCARASQGDRLPEFRECVEICKQTNCVEGGPVIPLHRRILLWTCPSECDYTCQHIITTARLARDPPYLSPVLQFHGKWPFHRFLGMQEPFSVLFSLFNYLAHAAGIAKLKATIPPSYTLRRYYVMFGYVGLASWVFSMVFHTRDSGVTEKLDYFAAGANVLFQCYYTPIRIFRLDVPTPRRQTLLRVWTLLCAVLYVAHVSYLSLWRWDYTYNMAANVAVGIVGNLMWSWFAVSRYRATGKGWTVWPGLIVAWIILAMSLELFDFAPWGGMLDAHSLWHLGTVGPTIWWYNFLVKDAQEDLQQNRLKA
ncbi:Mn2+ homeostasis protein [Pseudovirgaria hyperparasitica]|uniref:Post-GPI attachment to proteins factor 3 n=1 Tax=Pseudovirgaria hyperparasitica TaxID=470096 RepID=A0A6A6WIP1_9PEZI|nr:Mn2+ homeostasis protein [Pseudovirgaria hyperparasitica]KAF2761061.1 Mn2+ homeostasis protein [Pseudovirgaria hyperparasitica]